MPPRFVRREDSKEHRTSREGAHDGVNPRCAAAGDAGTSGGEDASGGPWVAGHTRGARSRAASCPSDLTRWRGWRRPRWAWGSGLAPFGASLLQVQVRVPGPGITFRAWGLGEEAEVRTLRFAPPNPGPGPANPKPQAQNVNPNPGPGPRSRESGKS